MPWKDRDKQREAIRKHYYANKQAYIDKAYRKRNAIRQWVHELKEKTPCTDCRKYYPYYVMDFDHLENKVITINRALNFGSWLKVKAEIEKCELVCSNCHRIRTHNRKNPGYNSDTPA